MSAPLTRPITIAALCCTFISVFALLVLMAGGSGSAPTAGPTGSGPRPGAGIHLEQRITQYAEGLSPRGGYRIPTEQERQMFTRAVGHVLDGDPEAARAELSEIDCTLNTITDAVGGRRYAELTDEVAGPGATRGWGRVYISLDHSPRWSVQVPHPIADTRTELLGVRVLRGSPGGVLIIAGAHRDAATSGAADVAHRDDSVFNSVTTELARRKLPGVQLHGFADESFRGRDAVVSTGIGDTAMPDAKRLTTALQRVGMSVCPAYSIRCKLAGRDNQQGRTAAAMQSRFVHLELNRTVRDSDVKLVQTATSITTLTEQWSKP
ncbi:hypothetical protein [Streptomyces sp. NPDC058623]|uniref:hypothetical protein n=1 Tax=Streptomyces sp. NPDC058623 TaxID=3346563 RepID=UPI00365AA415